MIEYEIITSQDKKELVKQINLYLKNGWKLKDDTFIGPNNTYNQVVLKEIDLPPMPEPSHEQPGPQTINEFIKEQKIGDAMNPDRPWWRNREN